GLHFHSPQAARRSAPTNNLPVIYVSLNTLRCWQRPWSRKRLCVFSTFRQAKHAVPACPTKPWRSREGRLDNRPALQRRLLMIPKSTPSRRAGVAVEQKIIPITNFAEKSDRASRFFVLTV